MKAKILSALIGAAGLAGLLATAHGQGTVFFDNYNCLPYYPVIYGPTCGALAGHLARDNVSVELGYALGANQTSGFTLIASSITAINVILVGGGYFQGPIVTIPGYVSGPVSFEILAWAGSSFDTAAYNTANSPYTWTEPAIQGVGHWAGSFQALPGYIILTPTPEPSTLALATLGALASLVAFRRKHACATCMDQTS